MFIYFFQINKLSPSCMTFGYPVTAIISIFWSNDKTLRYLLDKTLKYVLTRQPVDFKKWLDMGLYYKPFYDRKLQILVLS